MSQKQHLRVNFDTKYFKVVFVNTYVAHSLHCIISRLVGSHTLYITVIIIGFILPMT